MGEYILLDGQPFKVGTCEDLYYVRFDDLAAWVASGRATHHALGGNLPPADYLRGSFRFRFPFPDEDQIGPPYGDNYPRAVTVHAPAGFYAGVEHYTVSVRVNPNRGSFPPGQPAPWDWAGVNAAVPCPLSPAFDPEHAAPLPVACIVNIAQQRPCMGCLWVVCTCPYCGAKFRLDRDDAGALAAHVLANKPDELTRGIVERMMAGYDRQVFTD